MTTRALLALTVRSLREDTRVLGPHILRLLFAGLIFLFLVYSHVQSSVFGAPGLRFFTSICWLNVAFISVGAVSVFATPITEEKEEATLGLLRMAGINPLGLLLGKSSTRLFAAAIILTIQFPFTLLAITLGGVLWHQITAAYLSLLAYLVLVAQVGLICSVICARSSSAAGLSGILLAVFLVLPNYLQDVCQNLSGIPLLRWMGIDALADFFGQLVNASIWHTLGEVLMTGFQGDAFLFQVWTNLAAAGVLFLLACVTFDYFTRDHLTSVPARGALFRWRSAKSQPVLRRWCSPGRTWSLPHVWKEFYYVAGGFPMVVGKFASYFAIICLVTMFFVLTGPPPLSSVELFAKCAWATTLMLALVELAVYMSRIFREELRWQTFSSLMMLPGTVGGIACSKILGCLLTWFPAVFWLALGIIMDARDVGWFLKDGFDDVPALMVFFPLHYLVFLHLVLWLSLVLKWGGLPLSFVISYVLFWPTLIGCFSAIRLSQDTGNVLFALFDLGAMFLIVVLQLAIWQQLQTHAERA